MTLQAIILLTLKASIALVVLATALQSTAGGTTFLLRRPGMLLRSLTAMDIAMPVFAMAVVAIMPLPPAVKVALVALSVSPVPPFLPSKVIKSGGTQDYVIALFATTALLAIVFVPAAIFLLGRAFGVDAHIDASNIAQVLFGSVLAPLAGGIAIRLIWPRLAQIIAKPISIVATVLLAATTIAVYIALWPLMMTLVGDGAIVAFLAFVIVGLVVGHLLGGPERDDRTVLAFATASRHPGVAITIAAANFPEQKLAMAAVMLYLLVSVVGTIPYTLWRKRLVKAADHLHVSAG